MSDGAGAVLEGGDGYALEGDGDGERSWLGRWELRLSEGRCCCAWAFGLSHLYHIRFMVCAKVYSEL